MRRRCGKAAPDLPQEGGTIATAGGGRGWKPHLRKFRDACAESPAPLPEVRHLAAPPCKESHRPRSVAAVCMDGKPGQDEDGATQTSGVCEASPPSERGGPVALLSPSRTRVGRALRASRCSSSRCSNSPFPLRLARSARPTAPFASRHWWGESSPASHGGASSPSEPFSLFPNSARRRRVRLGWPAPRAPSLRSGRLSGPAADSLRSASCPRLCPRRGPLH